MLCGSRYYIKLANTLNCIHKVSSRYLIQHPPTCSYCRAELRYLGFTHLSSDPRNTVNVLIPIVFRLIVPIVKRDNNAIVLCLLQHCDSPCLSCSLLSSSPLLLSSLSPRRRRLYSESSSYTLYNQAFTSIPSVLFSLFHYICAGRTFSTILKMPYINGVYMASRPPPIPTPLRPSRKHPSTRTPPPAPRHPQPTPRHASPGTKCRPHEQRARKLPARPGSP